jgi:hypothetical protein
VTKIYYLELHRARASEGMLSCWSRLHLQSLAPTPVLRRVDVRRPVVKIITESLSQHDKNPKHRLNNTIILTLQYRFGVVGFILACYARGRWFDSRTVQTLLCLNLSVCIGSGCLYHFNMYVLFIRDRPINVFLAKTTFCYICIKFFELFLMTYQRFFHL